MLLRRLLLLVAVLLGLSVVTAALAPRNVLLRRSAPPPAPTAAAAPSAGPARQIARTLVVQDLLRPAHVRARAGDEILLTVRSNHLGTVDVGALAADQAVDAGSDAQFDLIAD